MTLLLVRHGQSEGNARGIIQGQLDLPLTPLGREQAKRVAERLRSEGGSERIVASPLARAFETAEVIGEALGLPIATDERLMEYDFGQGAGLTFAELREQFPASGVGWERGQRPPIPGEEKLDVFDARVAAALTDLLAEDGLTIGVAHGGVIGSALNHALQGGGDAPRLRVRTENCAITELARDSSGRLVLRRHNDACHVAASL